MQAHEAEVDARASLSLACFFDSTFWRLRGKPQVNGEGLERNEWQESAREEGNWNEPFLRGWRRRRPSRMRRLMVLSMRATMERTARRGRRTRFNGASDVVGGFKCMGVAVVLGTDPSHGLRHVGLCAPPQHAMYPAPSPHPGGDHVLKSKWSITYFEVIYLVMKH